MCEAILKALNESAVELDPPLDWLQMTDSMIVRAHQHAVGPRGTQRQGIGRSRGGRTTKTHLRTNGWGLPMRTDAAPGQTSNHKGFDLVMGDDLPTPGTLLADEGYDSDHIRPRAEARDAVPVIPMRRNRKARAGVDKSRHALRDLVERCFGKHKISRRMSIRYDKTATSFLGFVDIERIRLWTRRSVNTA